MLDGRCSMGKVKVVKEPSQTDLYSEGEDLVHMDQRGVRAYPGAMLSWKPASSSRERSW